METRDSEKMDLDRHTLLQLIKEMEGNKEFGEYLKHNRLDAIRDYDHDTILRYVRALHNIYVEVINTKGRAYGPSWQEDGEEHGIYPNTKRKFDRIRNLTLNPSIDVGDEPKHDTLMDLANYATMWDAFRIIKYLEWLGANNKGIEENVDRIVKGVVERFEGVVEESYYGKPCVEKVGNLNEKNIKKTGYKHNTGHKHNIVLGCNHCMTTHTIWEASKLNIVDEDIDQLLKGVHKAMNFIKRHTYCATKKGFVVGCKDPTGKFKIAEIEIGLIATYTDEDGDDLLLIQLYSEKLDDAIEAYTEFIDIERFLGEFMERSPRLSSFSANFVEFVHDDWGIDK